MPAKNFYLFNVVVTSDSGKTGQYEIQVTVVEACSTANNMKIQYSNFSDQVIYYESTPFNIELSSYFSTSVPNCPINQYQCLIHPSSEDCTTAGEAG